LLSSDNELRQQHPRPTPASPRPRATAHKEEGPELVRPQTETVVKRPLRDEAATSAPTELVRPQTETVVKRPLRDEPVAASELTPSEDLSQYAPRTVEVGIYGPIGPSRPVMVYACCDLATHQLRWVNDGGEILNEPPAAKNDPSMPFTPSDLVPSASSYSGLGSYGHSAPFYRSRFERLMNEGA